MESKAGYIFRNGKENHFERKSKHKSNKQVVPCNNRPTLRSDKNILKPCTYAKGIVQTSDNNVMKVKTECTYLFMTACISMVHNVRDETHSTAHFVTKPNSNVLTSSN